MYQSMSYYDQPSEFYPRQPCFIPNNSNAASLATSLGHRFQDPYYRCNQPQMLTFYPNLNRNPGVYHHMSGLAASRNYDDYSSGNCHYRLSNMREGYSASKLPPRPKNIVKITNPETGDNIFNELEKERKLNALNENKNENVPKMNDGENPQCSPVATSSTNLETQRSSIPNSISEESTSPKAFLNHDCTPPGQCESNSLMTNSSASSRPPSVSLASSSHEMTSTPNSSSCAAQQGTRSTLSCLKNHLCNFGNGRDGPAELSFGERSGYNDQHKPMYCNHIPMVLPAFGCRPPYMPPHVQQMPHPRYAGFYNLPHNYYDQPNYYYEGESMHPFFPHNSGHGFHQMHSRFPSIGPFSATMHHNSQSGSCSNSSEELNSEFDLNVLSSKLMEKTLHGRGVKYSGHANEPRDENKAKLNEDLPNILNNSMDANDDIMEPADKSISSVESSQCQKTEGHQCKDIKEIALDPNAKSFTYIGVLADSVKQVTGTGESQYSGINVDGGGNNLDTSMHLLHAG